jgi:hypothetical protein
VLTPVERHTGKTIYYIGVGIEPDCSEKGRAGGFVAESEVEAVIPMNRVTLDTVEGATNLMSRILIHLRQRARVSHIGMISHTE